MVNHPHRSYFRYLARLGVAAALSWAAGCASLQSVSVTAVPQQRDHMVQAEADNVAFLGIHFSNSFADGLRDELREQCPDGRVTGIFTKYETYWYVLVERRQVIATGYCVPAKGDAAPLSPIAAQARAQRSAVGGPS